MLANTDWKRVAHGFSELEPLDELQRRRSGLSVSDVAAERFAGRSSRNAYAVLCAMPSAYSPTLS